MSFDLIIFDLDGTLVDSSIDIAHAINYALEGTGAKEISVQQTIGLIGEGITRLLEKIIALENISADRDMLLRRFLEHYSAHLVDNTPVYPGVRETLDALDGCKKAVISNKREDLSMKVLDFMGLSKYFDLVVGSDTTSDRKPSPVPVNFVLSKFGIKPENAVIIGDSTYDIQAGKAAGITTIAVTYGYRPASILTDADYMVNSMPEVIKIVRAR